jgi:4-amino-4-deoxy-L-arabinose transferase-like glycosyltransferase
VIGDQSVAGAKSMAVPSSATRLRWLVPVLVAAVLVLPSVVWVAIDRSIWPWDPSWYGEVSVDLWATLRTDPSAWPSAMMHAFFGQKPPAVAWLGQLFVPLGEVFGRDQTALLLSTVLCQAAVVAFVYAASLRLANGATAMVAAFLVAASPLFVSMSHGYWAEPIQTVAVAWLVLILAGAAERRPALTLAQLPGALALAMLAKLSSPAYVAAPAAGVLLLVWLYRARPSDARPAWREPAVVASSVISAFLVVGALGWYWINVDAAIQQARSSSADMGSTASIPDSFASSPSGSSGSGMQRSFPDSGSHSAFSRLCRSVSPGCGERGLRFVTPGS